MFTLLTICLIAAGLAAFVFWQALRAASDVDGDEWCFHSDPKVSKNSRPSFVPGEGPGHLF